MEIRIYKNKEFKLLEGVYDPGEDSYLLVDAALKEARPGDRALEVGTGSGVVSLFIRDITEIVATDISPYACANARLNGVEVVRTDLFSGICGRFDLIIFNPPYLPTAEDERLPSWLDRAFNGGLSGRDEIVRFLADIDRVLAPGGRVITVFSSLTGIDEVRKLYEGKGFSVDQIGELKVSFEHLVVFRCERRP